jgi:hypothetical protein
LYYSSTIVNAAVLAAGLYVGERERYEKQGGLVVNFVVDLKRGRCDTVRLDH